MNRYYATDANVDEHDNSFPVTLRDVYFDDESTGEINIPIPGTRVITRYDNDGKIVPLNIVGRDYKPVQSVDVWSVTDKGLLHSFDGYNIEVFNSIAFLGKHCYKEYRMLKHNDPSSHLLRVVVRNSHGQHALTVMVGVFDMVCSNGMILGQYDSLRQSHTGNFSTKRIYEHVQRCGTMWRTFCHQANVWSRTRMTFNDVRRLCIQLTEDGVYAAGVAEKIRVNFFEDYQIHGETVWGFVSAMTKYATHQAVHDTQGKVTNIVTRQAYAGKVANKLFGKLS